MTAQTAAGGGAPGRAKVRHVYEEAVMAQKINPYNRKIHPSQ
jgi:hypothetical protein